MLTQTVFRASQQISLPNFAILPLNVMHVNYPLPCMFSMTDRTYFTVTFHTYNFLVLYSRVFYKQITITHSSLGTMCLCTRQKVEFFEIGIVETVVFFLFNHLIYFHSA